MKVPNQISFCTFRGGRSLSTHLEAVFPSWGLLQQGPRRAAIFSLPGSWHLQQLNTNASCELPNQRPSSSPISLIFCGAFVADGKVGQPHFCSFSGPLSSPGRLGRDHCLQGFVSHRADASHDLWRAETARMARFLLPFCAPRLEGGYGILTSRFLTHGTRNDCRGRPAYCTRSRFAYMHNMCPTSSLL
jgi:hypothetical protein